MRGAGEFDELGVGLADELNAEAEDAVEEDEGADELARLVAGLRFPEHPGEDREQDDAFQDRFIKLGWMARRPKYGQAGDDLGEADRPRDVRSGGRAPQFMVHEIGDPAEEQAEW